MKSRTVLKKIFEFKVYIKKHLIILTVIGILSFFSILTAFAQPIIWANLIESINKKEKNLYNLLIFLIVIKIASIVINYIYQILSIKVRLDVEKEIKSDMIDNLMTFDMRYFDNMKVGEYISRFHSDVVVVRNFLVKSSMTIVSGLVKVIVLGIFIGKVNILLLFLLIFISFFSHVNYKKFSEKIRKIYKKERLIADKYFTSLNQTIQGIREIKVLKLQNWAKNKNKNIFDQIQKIDSKYEKIRVTSELIPQLIDVLTFATILFFIIITMDRSVIKISDFIVFTSYGTIFTLAMRDIIKIISTLKSSIISFERIANILTKKTKTKTLKYKNLNNPSILEVKDVSLNFGEYKVFKDLSFEVKENSLTMILGVSGEGKTSILNLITNLYKIDGGIITLDGVPICEGSEALKEVSYVTQSPYIFNETILENFKIVRPEGTFSEIIEATKQAFIYDYIVSLPDGFNTIINENNFNISGGEKQRLALARAIYLNKKVLLLDEITSSLDINSKKNIQNTIKRLSKKRIVIYISHDLEELKLAENIIVLSNGRIESIGNFEYIKNKSLLYQNLIQKINFKED